MIGTKARVLRLLAAAPSDRFVVDPFLNFTVQEWRDSCERILAEVARDDRLGTVVAVRSSAWDEDGTPHITAGLFRTHLEVPVRSSARLRQAIDDVISSYAARSDAPRRPEHDEVLVQRQVLQHDVKVSGVMSTRDPVAGGPYLTVEFDDVTGRTDTVTSGQFCRRITLLHPGTQGQELESAWRILMAASRALEEILNAHDLVVEFAIDRDNRLHVFQAWPRSRVLPSTDHDRQIRRTISRAQRKLRAREHGLWSDMTDWNPAEMLGVRPAPLDISLYERLITNSVWAEARAGMGYHDVRPRRLMTVIAGKPYIDVEASFLSFTPVGVDEATRQRLVADRLEYLRANPHLHDKAELEVFPTCAELGSAPRLTTVGGLTKLERSSLQASLSALTRDIIASSNATFAAANAHASRLAESRRRFGATPNSDVNVIRAKLQVCRRHGTLPFAKVARDAFIARDILNSLRREDAVSDEWLDQFWSSLTTVASSVSEALLRTQDGQEDGLADFLRRYGHLRPRTYDLTSDRYDAFPPSLALAAATPRTRPVVEPLAAREHRAVSKLLKAAGLPEDPGVLLSFARAATEARELAKFAFSSVLSDVLEDIAALGAHQGLSREDIAQLRIGEILAKDVSVQNWRQIIESRRIEATINRCVVLPPLVSRPQDLTEIRAYDSQPNFITTRVVEEDVVALDNIQRRECADLHGKIVAIEAADPGYDWIFGCTIAGLLTRFGGAASHMAIRCGEFSIPAAIGCGEYLFSRAVEVGHVHLDCARREVRFTP